MSDDKKKKKKNPSKKKVVVSSDKKKGNGSFINIVLFIILIVGLGWLGYSNGYFNKTSDKSGTLKNATQVEKFINNNGKMLFSGAEFKVKSTEKEDGIWRSILEIKGQLQDFYTTTDGQIIIGSETVKNILQSDKDEVVGDVDKNGKLHADDALKSKMQEFIEKNLVQPGTKIEVTGVSEEHGLIKVVAKAQGQEQTLYITPNGKRLVFGLISLEDYKKQIEEQSKAQKKAAEVSEENKSDKPRVDIFVMSYCPYGTQIEKGIIPVLRLLKDKIDAKIRFVNYAMHNKKEVDENIVQYCIQKDTPDKFYDYLECFLKEGKSKDCVQKTGIDADKLASCSDATDKEFKITESYNDKSTWKGQFPSFAIDNADNEKYGVGGSPTLVVNGQTLSSARDSQSLLKAICSAFKTPPAECDKKLSSDSPSAGFGTAKTKSSTGSAPSGGGCAQ